MATFSSGVLLLLAAIAGVAVLGVLSVIASSVRHAAEVRALHAAAARVREAYARHLASESDVIVVDEAPPETVG